MRGHAFIILSVAVLSLTSSLTGQRAADPRHVVFTDVTRQAGLDVRQVNGVSPEKHLVETMGSGALFFDFDNDGWIDIFIVDGGSLADAALAKTARHRLFRNRRDGTFADVTPASGIQHREYGMGACAGDMDNDGWTDLYVTTFGRNVLYRNNRGASFVDVTAASGTGGVSQWTTSCAFADLDRDGDLDLFTTNYVDASAQKAPFCGNAELKVRVYCHPLNFQPLPNVFYRNAGNGKFVDASAEAGIAKHRGNGLGVIVADLDDDEWPDVFVANDTMPNFLFFNEKGRFKESALLAGVAVAIDGAPRAGMGTDAGDYDGDGRLDLVVTNLDLETHSVFRNLGGRLFAYVTPAVGLSAPTRPFVGFGVNWFDYDNDGAVDLAIANGHVLDNTAVLRAGSRHAQRMQLFRNVKGRFVETGRQSGAIFEAERVRRGLAVGDFDNDGDEDLLLTTNGGAVELLRNDGGNARTSLLVRAVGTTSNRDGIGARLRVTAGGRTQIREIRSGSSYLSQSDLRAHFGLGGAEVVDRLEVRWPGGRVDVLEKVRAGQIVTVAEGKGLQSATPFAR
jgi:hypothetical protein